MAPAFECIGRYVLYDELASGGMASVHLGRLVGPVGFNRTVAVKRMHAGVARNAEFVAMFVDEARLAARIRHPNVVPTLDVVQTDDELFLVMEYVHGESLAYLLQAAAQEGRPMPPAVAVAILVGVLHGLHAAHEATAEDGTPLNIVHRDVSPHNILVGVDGVARVFDFGIAKAQGRLHSTSDGQVKGKLAYMAPEQLDGEDVNREADVYAAGVVLWEALAGRRLFSAKLQTLLLAQVLAGTTELPSRHAPSLPEGLDEITMRALALNPKDRFTSARDLAIALERCLPPASPTVVGAWVEQKAEGPLSHRRKRLAVVESQPGLTDGRDEHPPLTPISITGPRDSGSSPRRPGEEATAIGSARAPGEAPIHTLVSADFSTEDSDGAQERPPTSAARPQPDRSPPVAPEASWAGVGPSGTKPSMERPSAAGAAEPVVDSEAAVPTQAFDDRPTGPGDQAAAVADVPSQAAPSTSVVASLRGANHRAPRRVALVALLAVLAGATAALWLLLPAGGTAGPPGPRPTAEPPPRGRPDRDVGDQPAAAPSGRGTPTGTAASATPSGRVRSPGTASTTPPVGQVPTATTATRPRPPPRPPATVSARPGNCDPPYTIDDRGIQRLKPHCL